MRRACFIGLLLLGALPAVGQQYPEVEALLDAFFAKDLRTALKHVPLSLQKTISDLPPSLQAALGQELLMAERWRREGRKVTRGDREVLLTTEQGVENERELTEYSLDRRVSDGYQTVLWLRAKYAEAFSSHIEVWMRYEEGEWRIFELLPRPVWNGMIDLNDPEIAERFVRPIAQPNEGAAIQVLWRYQSACRVYVDRFPELGVPSSLEVLGAMREDDVPADDEEPATGKPLLPTELTAPPFEKSGYKFTYLVGPGTPATEYTIIARPVEFGKTGKRSFFTDESGVIRFTDEDRAARKDDPPIR